MQFDAGAVALSSVILQGWHVFAAFVNDVPINNPCDCSYWVETQKVAEREDKHSKAGFHLGGAGSLAPPPPWKVSEVATNHTCNTYTSKRFQWWKCPKQQFCSFLSHKLAEASRYVRWETHPTSLKHYTRNRGKPVDITDRLSSSECSEATRNSLRG